MSYSIMDDKAMVVIRCSTVMVKEPVKHLSVSGQCQIPCSREKTTAILDGMIDLCGFFLLSINYHPLHLWDVRCV